LFLSGSQHFVEIPEGMAHMPAYVKEFLRQLPTGWDDVKFIDGFPGEYVVLARKSGNKWYIAGINATNEEKTVALNLAAFKGKKAMGFVNSKGDNFIDQKDLVVKPGQPENITLGAHDGFVLVVE
jgi:hypothetical protein